MGGVVLDRPFHIIIVLWGRGFADCFLEYCLPSFLAPGNLPSLRTRQRSKLLIATTPADWEYIKASPILRSVERYVETVFLEIPPCPPGQSGCVHMGIGHRVACQLAYDEKAYAMVITPDSMISDGTIQNLQERAASGVELVWVSALRFAEESFLGHLHAFDLIPKGSRAQTGEPIVVSGRDMVLAGVNGLHTETLTYEWAASYFPQTPSAVWWRVPGENGLVVHSLSWAPLLMDFGAVKAHDTSCLENWTIDGDYVFRNLGDDPRIHVVQDSDEVFFCSWAPYDDRPARMAPRHRHKFNWVNQWAKSAEFHAAFYGPTFDPLKRKIFFLPVRWHANPINRKWKTVERRAARTLRFVLGGDPSSVVGIGGRVSSIIFGITTAATNLVARLAGIVARIWKHREIIATRLCEFSVRDPRSRHRALWRAWQAWTFARTGRLPHELEEHSLLQSRTGFAGLAQAALSGLFLLTLVIASWAAKFGRGLASLHKRLVHR